MRVIFISDVQGSGLAGEIKEVKNGYARNFLLPKKLAVMANHDQLQRIEAIRKAGDERRLKEEQDLRALSELLSQVTLNIVERIGPTGRFYGAVTTTHVAEELERIAEREFDRRSITMEGPIHEPGEYQAELRFAFGISATVQVVVEGEDAQGNRVGPPREVEQPEMEASEDSEEEVAETEASPELQEEPEIQSEEDDG